MDILLLSYYISQPLILAFVAALLLAFAAGLSWQFPLLPAFVYFGVIFGFSSSTYGTLTAVSGNVYSRGSGQLFFPFVLWILVLSVGWLNFSKGFISGARVQSPRIYKWFWLWFLLLLAHTVWGLVIGIKIPELLSTDGFINIPWMGLAIALLVAGARDDKSISYLVHFVVLAGLLKSWFGLVRWAAFGGDPANVYANFEKIQVKLTYFDIGDSLVCMLAIAVCAYLLFVAQDKKEPAWWRRIQWVTLLSCLLCIALSYRRTAWIGVLLAMLLLLIKLKPIARTAAVLIVLPMLLTGIGYVFYQRLGAQADKLGAFSFFYDLIGSSRGPESPRLLELRLAYKEFASSPIVGIGSWGRYAATMLISWQDPTKPGAFLHSGILHILMKTGLLGLGLLMGVLFAFVREVKACRGSSAGGSALAFAACCGLLFMLPDFFGGTPIPQFRTTQLLGFCLALPFFVNHVALRNKAMG